VQRIPKAPNLSFLDRSRNVLEIDPQLSSRDWVDPVPDQLLFRKTGNTGNRNQDHWICSQEPQRRFKAEVACFNRIIHLPVICPYASWGTTSRNWMGERRRCVARSTPRPLWSQKRSLSTGRTLGRRLRHCERDGEERVLSPNRVAQPEIQSLYWLSCHIICVQQTKSMELWVLLENLRFIHFLKNFPTFYETRRYITM
jgi:hypothetical protein